MAEGWDLPAGDGWGCSAGAGAGSNESWDGTSSIPSDGWGSAARVAPAPARVPRKDLPPRREHDDEAAAKKVDGITSKVLTDKKKLAAVRNEMNQIDAKRNEIQLQVDALMPELQEMRMQKTAAMGQLQDARLPQAYMDKAKDLKHRSRALPGGCTSLAALQRAIREAEDSIGRTAVGIAQEKAALARIRELKQGKAAVAAYEADQAALDKVRRPPLDQHRCPPRPHRPTATSASRPAASMSAII